MSFLNDELAVSHPNCFVIWQYGLLSKVPYGYASMLSRRTPWRGHSIPGVELRS
jgi:hypothetical protein